MVVAIDSFIKEYVIEGAKLYPGPIKYLGQFTLRILSLSGGKRKSGIAGGKFINKMK